MTKQRKTILLVDDEPNILAPLEFLIKKEGYQTLTASNGKQAIALMQQAQPDMVLLDVMMPEMNGFETAQEIRKNPAWEHIHIVFLTAKSTSEDKINGYSSGGEIYLTKPFDNDELLHTVNEILEFG
ncbi:MAG: response regulator [Bacteroidota bacterium]